MAQQAAERSQTESALKEKEARCGQLESELAGLRHSHEEFQGKHAAEQDAAAKAQQEVQGLQEQLRQSVTELEQAKAGMAQQAAERSQTESALKEKEARCGQLESELAGLRSMAEQREKHKKLIEALRENVLQLHASLHDGEST
jgi:chromosome segregation ATPase